MFLNIEEAGVADVEAGLADEDEEVNIEEVEVAEEVRAEEVEAEEVIADDGVAYDGVAYEAEEVKAEDVEEVIIMETKADGDKSVLDKMYFDLKKRIDILEENNLKDKAEREKKEKRKEKEEGGKREEADGERGKQAYNIVDELMEENKFLSDMCIEMKDEIKSLKRQVRDLKERPKKNIHQGPKTKNLKKFLKLSHDSVSVAGCSSKRSSPPKRSGIGSLRRSMRNLSKCKAVQSSNTVPIYVETDSENHMSS